MGDGRVALILDVLGLAQQANVVSGVRERALSEKTGQRGRAGRRSPDRPAVRHAPTAAAWRFRLSQVARLEEFPRSSLERVGAAGRGPVSRRDPAADPRVAGTAATPAEATVKSRRRADAPGGHGQRHDPGRRLLRRRAGASAWSSTSILDIVEETLVVRSAAHRPGVLFTAVIQGRVTEFLDIERDSSARSIPTSSSRGRPYGGGLTVADDTPILHVLPGRPLLRPGRAEGAGNHPLPGDDAGAAGPAGGARADQPARADRHGHRPAPPARACATGPPTVAGERGRPDRRRRGQLAGR